VFTVPLPPEVTDPDSLKEDRRERRDSIRDVERRRRHDENRELPEDQWARDDAGRWNDGRFEIHRAPGDSLKAYAQWGDSLTLSDDPAADREVREIQSNLERMASKLPDELTGRRSHGFTWDRIIDAVRYNRVQGLAPGLGYQLTLPGDRFTTLRGELRFGLSDQRLVGSLFLVREAPGARWTLTGYRDLKSNDPYGRGNGFGNSLNALFVGHDDADYHLAQGVRLVREGSLGVGLELTTTLMLEDEQSVRREAKSWLNDALGGSGDFPANPPVTDGSYGGAAIRLDHGVLRSRWTLAADLLGNRDRGTVRAFGSYRRSFWSGSGAPTIMLGAGIASDSPLPQQTFRIGGLNSVRGFDYGTRRGQAFWAAQLDWPLKRGLVQPMLFADAGQAAQASELFRSSVIAGGGAGLALLGGVLRFDLSHPFTDGGSGLRFDLGVRGFF
jgi:Haemolysin secretion/activation protein ShlB/FhaC/HecB